MRSQTGPLSSLPFTVLPTNRFTRFDPQPFRVLLLRRLHFPLSLTARQCRCGRPLDACGHHRSACAVAGVLGRRGYPLETAAAQVCREAGARVRLNTMVRDLDLLPGALLDNRRLEVVADGLPLTTRHRHHNGVSAKRRWHSPKRCQHTSAGDGSRARLVVLATEVGGRWSQETRQFLVALAKAKSREAPPPLQGSVKAAWLHRWSCLLGCTAARSFALSLVDGLAPNGPTHR